MRELADRCSNAFSDRASVERLLAAEIAVTPHCKHLFALDSEGRQFVDNITHRGPDASHFGRDRSERPYLQGLIGSTDFKLSDAYISRNRKVPMLTAMQVVRDEAGHHLGFLGADFDLRELPATQSLYRDTQVWRQVKGDPAIRGGLFAQRRAQSLIDDHLDTVLPLMNELMTDRGVFHGKLHFSSNRATIWVMDDPFNYRLLDSAELLDPDICLAYRARPYPEAASVPLGEVANVLEMFRKLRFADETIYLRSGSLNICNGLVSLNFSCDGTHYMRYDELLGRGMEFWLGGGG
ncbi:MAG: PDC sensor domain-containing protein [Novosphingobium sp.]|nr:PDC sensor domain-containing protein [Novosphingobium sp.]